MTEVTRCFSVIIVIIGAQFHAESSINERGKYRHELGR